MASGNPYQLYPNETPVITVEHATGGSSHAGQIDPKNYRTDFHGRILAGPSRKHEEEFERWDREQYAAAHPTEFKESRGAHAQEHDPARLVR